MTIEFHPRVYSEVDAIMRYYEGVTGPTLAEDFYSEFRNTVIEAAEDPQRVSVTVGRIQTRESTKVSL